MPRLASSCVDWGLAPATIAFFTASSQDAKKWGATVLNEFAPKFTGDEVKFACFNMSEVQSACDIENHLNEAKLIRTKAS